jgi:hypothetical protein
MVATISSRKSVSFIGRLTPPGLPYYPRALCASPVLGRSSDRGEYTGMRGLISVIRYMSWASNLARPRTKYGFLSSQHGRLPIVSNGPQRNSTINMSVTV